MKRRFSLFTYPMMDIKAAETELIKCTKKVYGVHGQKL